MHFFYAFVAALLVVVASSSANPDQHTSKTTNWPHKLQDATSSLLRRSENVAICMRNEQARECSSIRTYGSENVAICMRNGQSRKCSSRHTYGSKTISIWAASEALNLLDRFCYQIESGTLGFLPSPTAAKDMVGNATRLVDSIKLFLTYSERFSESKAPQFELLTRRDGYDIREQTSGIAQRLRNLAPIWQQLETTRQGVEDANDTKITMQQQELQDHHGYGSILRRSYDRVKSSFSNAVRFGSSSTTTTAQTTWARVTTCDSPHCELNSTVTLIFWHGIDSSALQKTCLDASFSWENHPQVSIPIVAHYADQETITIRKKSSMRYKIRSLDDTPATKQDTSKYHVLPANALEDTWNRFNSFDHLLPAERRSTLRSIFCAKPFEDMDNDRPSATIAFRETVLAQDATQAWNEIVLPVVPLVPRRSNGRCGTLSDEDVMRNSSELSSRKQAFFWRVLAEYPRPAVEIAEELRDQLTAGKTKKSSSGELKTDQEDAFRQEL